LRCPYCGDNFFLEQGTREELWAHIQGGARKPEPPPPPPPPRKRQPTELELMEADLDAQMRTELFKAMRPKEKIEALKKEFPHYPPEVWEELLEKYDPNELRININRPRLD
jgi:hypothetical protein